MKTHPFLFVLAAAACILTAFTGCSSSKLAEIWRDTEYSGPQMRKMLVVAVGKYPARRRIWEDAFTAELAKHNVDATPSYRLFPDGVPDTNQVIESVRTNGFGGVLVTRWMPPETNPQISQPFYTHEPSTRYDRRRERFVTYYHNVEHPAIIDSQKVNIRSIDVWTTKGDGEMIWSATSRTPELESVQDARPEIIKLVMDELSGNSIIAGERK